MRAVIEDIAGRGIDGDGASIRRRVWLLPVDGYQSVASLAHWTRDILPSVQLQCLKLLLCNLCTHLGELRFKLH